MARPDLDRRCLRPSDLGISRIHHQQPCAACLGKVYGRRCSVPPVPGKRRLQGRGPVRLVSGALLRRDRRGSLGFLVAKGCACSVEVIAPGTCFGSGPGSVGCVSCGFPHKLSGQHCEASRLKHVDCATTEAIPAGNRTIQAEAAEAGLLQYRRRAFGTRRRVICGAFHFLLASSLPSQNPKALRFPSRNSALPANGVPGKAQNSAGGKVWGLVRPGAGHALSVKCRNQAMTLNHPQSVPAKRWGHKALALQG
jgi:hypothetical protein